MRTFVLAASLIASFAAPSFAQGRHHNTMPNRAADFVGLAQDGGQVGDRTSPRLNDGANRCAWTAVCGY